MAAEAEQFLKPQDPYKLINLHKRDKKAGVTSDQIHNAFDAWLLYWAQCPPCNDGCTDALNNADTDIPLACGKYLVQWGEKRQKDRNQVLVDWVRCAMANGNGVSTKYKFPLPYSGEGLTPEQLSTIKSHKHICKRALCGIFSKKKDGWATISQTAKKTAIVSPHGLCGKRGNRKRSENDPVMINLKKFMQQLEKEGEPCATRIVREEVGLATARDNNEKDIFLPLTHGRRTCYRSYCLAHGRLATANHKGNYKKRWIGEGAPKKNIVGYTTFYNYWRTEYPHLKVMNKHEDVCNLCFIFANRKKMRCNSSPEDTDDLSAVSDNSGDDGAGIGCRGHRQYEDDLILGWKFPWKMMKHCHRQVRKSSLMTRSVRLLGMLLLQKHKESCTVLE